MSNPKINKSLWYGRGLVVLVCILFLVLATGTAEARYRAERDVLLQYQVWEPAQIYMGTLSEITAGTGGTSATEPTEVTAESAVFSPEETLTWTEALGVRKMELAVANGSSEEDAYAKDQRIRLQLIGSLGLGTEEMFPKIELKVPSEEDPAIYETFQGTASRITEGSMLYHSVGSGWIIRFRDAEGQEPSWILKGGSLSYQSFTITVENLLIDNDVMLQPQAVATVIQK